MKQLFLSLLTFLVFSQKMAAQPAATATESQFAPTTAENSLLWRISGKNLATASYLYGTIHIIGKEDFFVTDSTQAALDRAKLVTFEINMQDMMDLSSQMSLMMKSFMSGNQSLKDLVSAEDYQLIKDHFDEMGLPIFLFERMKPMFLTVLADMDLSGGIGGEDAAMVSYEMKFMEMAEAQKKKIGGLETAEYQMSMFDSIPYKEQAQMLVEAIKSSSGGDQTFDEMVKLYKNQDIVGMGSMMSSEEGGIGGYEDLLLVTRNKNWIPVMAGMMAEQPTFFAVGAGHLGGENGVVALLRKEGYQLEPVR